MVVDLIPKSRLGEGMGYFSISTTVGAIISPSIGILIYESFSFDVLIWSSVVLSLLAVIALQFVKASPTTVKREKQPFRFLDMIFEREVWFPALLTVITTLGFGAVITFLVLLESKGDRSYFPILSYQCNCSNFNTPIYWEMV